MCVCRSRLFNSTEPGNFFFFFRFSYIEKVLPECFYSGLLILYVNRKEVLHISFQCNFIQHKLIDVCEEIRKIHIAVCNLSGRVPNSVGHWLTFLLLGRFWFTERPVAMNQGFMVPLSLSKKIIEYHL